MCAKIPFSPDASHRRQPKLEFLDLKPHKGWHFGKNKIPINREPQSGRNFIPIIVVKINVVPTALNKQDDFFYQNAVPTALSTIIFAS